MTDIIGPTVPTPKTPISMSVVDDGTYQMDFDKLIENSGNASSASLASSSSTTTRRFINFLLRMHPAFILTLIPTAMIWSGFYAPSWFFAWCVLYNSYSIYIIGHILYWGFYAMRRARKSRSINYYQKYLQKYKMMMSSSSSNRKFNSSAAVVGDNCSSSGSSDEDDNTSGSINGMNGGNNTNTSRFNHRMRQLRNKGERTDETWNSVVHFVIIPNYNERESILRQSLNSLAQQSIARRQIIPVLAMEEREVNVETKAKRLCSDYGLQFRDIIYTLHSSGIPDETPGKGSNSNYAFHNGVREYVESRPDEIDPNYAVVTVQDADSIYHENHFDSLTYAFLVSHLYGSNNTSIWQAPMACYRNFNEIPGFTRTLAFLITLHELAALSDESFENISFSTYSSSYVFILNAMNGWCPKYITEDWHFTVRAFFNSGGLTKVYGLPFPISCYSTQSDTYWNTIYERIVQAKRHTLAFTELPYFLKRMILTYMNGTSIPAYVQPTYHNILSPQQHKMLNQQHNNVDLEEQDLKMRTPKVNWARMLRLFWNLSSVQFIGGTQLTVVLMSFLFTQYYNYIYHYGGGAAEATTNDSIYWANYLWIPLLNLTNVILFVLVPPIVYLNDKLITYVNGREYQSKWWVVRHWAEWWLFSAIANLLLVIGPTYHTVFEMIFKDRYVFARSTKPEAPHLFRKKKTTGTQQKRNSRKKSNATLTIITDVLRSNGIVGNSIGSIGNIGNIGSGSVTEGSKTIDEFVIDVTAAATTDKKKKVISSSNNSHHHHHHHHHHTRSESNSTDSIASNSSCSSEEDEVLSDSSIDCTSPVTSNNAVALVRERSHSGPEKYDTHKHKPLIRHVSATAASKKNVKVEVVVALR